MIFDALFLAALWLLLILMLIGAFRYAFMSHSRSTEHKILELLYEIRDILRPRKSATLTIATKHRRKDSMPASILVGKTATAVYKEFDGPNGTGNELPPAGTPNFSSSDPTVATVDSTGKITGVHPGSAVITGSDPANGLSASDTVSVSQAPPSPTAQSATLTITAD